MTRQEVSYSCDTSRSEIWMLRIAWVAETDAGTTRRIIVRFVLRKTRDEVISNRKRLKQKDGRSISHHGRSNQAELPSVQRGQNRP